MAWNGSYPFHINLDIRVISWNNDCSDYIPDSAQHRWGYEHLLELDVSDP